jgi:hypothetical protein
LTPAIFKKLDKTTENCDPNTDPRIGGTIEMDCSAIYATEYPILWVKLPSGCTIERESLANNIRSIVSDNCTPIPLSSGSALIIRDNRFR